MQYQTTHLLFNMYFILNSNIKLYFHLINILDINLIFISYPTSNCYLCEISYFMSSFWPQRIFKKSSFLEERKKTFTALPNPSLITILIEEKKVQYEQELSISLRSFNQCLTRDENFQGFSSFTLFFLNKK